MKLDQSDLRILELVQQDATLSSGQIAERIGLSQSPTWRRLTNLEKSGVIRERVTLIDRTSVGLSLLVNVLVRLSDQAEGTVSRFKEAALAIPEIIQCQMLMGDIDFLLLVCTLDMESYLALLRQQISQLPGVRGIDSRVVVEETRSFPRLPIEILTGR